MDIIAMIFGDPTIRQLPPHEKQEVKRLLTELVKIGNLDDYLSLQPGGPFNVRCHHMRARKIGERLHQIGGVDLMHSGRSHVKRKLKSVMAEHLDYCWQDIGEWQP